MVEVRITLRAAHPPHLKKGELKILHDPTMNLHIQVTNKKSKSVYNLQLKQSSKW